MYKHPIPLHPPQASEKIKTVTPNLNPEILEILDSSTRLTLITFLAIFACVGLYTFNLFNSRELRGSHNSKKVDNPRPWQVLRPSLNALFFSSIFALLAFFFYAFSPAPFLKNFSTSKEWKRAPLRIISLKHTRSYEGFSLKGEFWNQKNKTLENIQVMISIFDHNKDKLEQVKTAPLPSTLEGGKTATFEIEYSNNSSLIYGYQISFHRNDGSSINHVAGFNVE